LKSLDAAAVDALRAELLAGDESLAPVLAELRALRRELADREMTGPGADPQEAQRFMMEMRTQRERQRSLDRHLWLRTDPAAIRAAIAAATPRAIAEALSDGAVFVEYIQHHRISFDELGKPVAGADPHLVYSAFAVTAGEVRFFEVGRADVIDRAIAELRDALADSLLGPLRDVLRGSRQLLLAPDGELWRLPFAALPFGDGFLIDALEVTYVSSGREILRITQPMRERAAGPPLVIAAPAYGDAIPDPPSESVEVPQVDEEEAAVQRAASALRGEGIHFRDLDGARREGQDVGRILGVEPVMGDAAVKEVVFRAQSPAVLHLATHGFFLENGFGELAEQLGFDMLIAAEHAIGGRGSARLPNPLLRCGLAFAGANYWMAWQPTPPGAGNGLLTAEEVAMLDLRDTELVVLSACDTGLGELRRGQGVFGLRRAFEHAGARTLIVSLWSLPDEETVELVHLLYDHLLRGESCASALRNAQLAMKDRYESAYYWAGFVCQGDPRPLTVKFHHE
ncbi:MAG: CHAT domain-containing protein, partial [Thermoanaerobaculia bacterium]